MEHLCMIRARACSLIHSGLDIPLLTNCCLTTFCATGLKIVKGMDMLESASKLH